MHHELLARIRNLEGLLQRQASSQAGTPTGAASPLGASSVADSFSESELGTALENWGRPLLSNVGTLHTSASGHVRYVPMASQWESVVARGPAAECLRRSDLDIAEDDDLMIPLTQNGNASRGELLALLPPNRYCDILKDVYLRVFSPVSPERAERRRRVKLTFREGLPYSARSDFQCRISAIYPRSQQRVFIVARFVVCNTGHRI